MWSGFAGLPFTDGLFNLVHPQVGAKKERVKMQHTPRKRLGRGARGGIATTTTWVADALALHARVSIF